MIKVKQLLVQKCIKHYKSQIFLLLKIPHSSDSIEPYARWKKGGKKAADELYDKLGKGKPDKPKGYPGEGKRLPNGDWVGRRPVSKHGEPAIDLDVKDFPYKKIKFPD